MIDKNINSQIEKEKDVHIQLLKECMWDIRDQRNFFKVMMIILSVLLFLMIGMTTLICLHNQKLLSELPAKTETEIVTSNSNQ